MLSMWLSLYHTNVLIAYWFRDINPLLSLNDMCGDTIVRSILDASYNALGAMVPKINHIVW